MYFRLILIFNLLVLHAYALNQAPDFQALDINNQTVSYQKSKAKKDILFVFWASWCQACRHEIPHLIALQNDPNRSFEILGINLDQNLKKAKKIIKETHINYTNWFDPRGQVADLFQIKSTPSLFLVNQDGKIIKKANRISKIFPDLKVSVSRDLTLMGTNINFLLENQPIEKLNLAHQAIDQAIEELKRIENLLTDWRDSPLMKINYQAGLKPVQITKETFDLLSKAKSISQLTDGAFDISYSPLGKLWDYSKPGSKPPSEQTIQQALQLVGSQHLQLDPLKQTAFLEKLKMRIDLGGIAKGYAIQQASAVLLKAGFKNHVIRAGGDIYARGFNQNKTWRIEIPGYAILPISNGAVSTSGNSERFFEYQGKRYGHLINPKTGYPTEQLKSVSIITKDPILADALSTAVFIMGLKPGLKFVNQTKEIEAVIVDSTGKLFLSNGLIRPTPNKRQMPPS